MNIDLVNAIAVVGGLGVFCGVTLGLVARFFGVKEDPRVAAVRDVLPGANCGACGFAGCDDYARALVLQGASLTA
ncbi:MAG: ferredoxin, partial [Lentisphaerae bacterium]|nr:ferredoxin [Lentisphaerota bacterium]